MTSAHAFEVPPHSAAPAEAVDAAVEGRVVYLTRNGEPVAAIVPADVATAGAAAIEALETLRTFERPHGAGRSWSGHSARKRAGVYADNLAEYPDER